jgi:hypothetical protein
VPPLETAAVTALLRVSNLCEMTLLSFYKNIK